jgi:hypothetical protein
MFRLVISEQDAILQLMPLNHWMKKRIGGVRTNCALPTLVKSAIQPRAQTSHSIGCRMVDTSGEREFMYKRDIHYSTSIFTRSGYFQRPEMLQRLMSPS